jgi:CheY-like chemotaxis protein
MNGSLCILLVEDDAALARVTSACLAYLGHESSHAPSLAHAKRLLHPSHGFHMLLLDLELGDERGETLVEHLRTNCIRLPRIIIFSALPMPELQRAANEVGASVTLQKPCSPADLKRAIDKAVA